MDAGYFPQRCSLATSCSPTCFSPWLLCLPHSLAQKEGPGTGRMSAVEAAASQGAAEGLLGQWGQPCLWAEARKLGELLWHRIFLFFALLGHHGGSTRAQNFQRQKHPFSMLFIKYRVHFMLLLAQANTFASWHSLRTAVHSIKTEERANVACVPASA